MATLYSPLIRHLSRFLLYSKRPSRSHGFNPKIGLKNEPLWVQTEQKRCWEFCPWTSNIASKTQNCGKTRTDWAKWLFIQVSVAPNGVESVEISQTASPFLYFVPQCNLKQTLAIVVNCSLAALQYQSLSFHTNTFQTSFNFRGIQTFGSNNGFITTTFLAGWDNVKN